MAQRTPDAPREQWAKAADTHRTDFEKPEKPLKYQAGAWALWIVALAVEYLGTLAASSALQIPVLSTIPVLTVVLIVVINALLVLTAQNLWKRATALAGARGQGLLAAAMACLAFPPMALFFVLAKNASTAIKACAVIFAVIDVAIIVVLCLCW